MCAALLTPVLSQAKAASVRTAAVVVAIWMASPPSLLAQVPANAGGDGKGVQVEEAGPHKWALLIGVEKYHRAPPLRFTVNDVQQIGLTLRQRGDYKTENILELIDSATNPRYQPLRSSLLAEVPAFLAKPGTEDVVLVYFSGHGFRDKEGRLYLAPMDCDPDNPAPTGVTVEWFRQQLASCKAKTKILLLDACHAGSEKGDDKDGSVAAKDLGVPFRDVEGVITLASSSSEEKSQIWFEKEQSLFSYWLNQGLKGHADLDGDGSVSIDELYGYVYRNVTESAKARFSRPQTPVRIVRSGTQGVPVVVRLMPQGLKQVLDDISEQLAWTLEERKLAKIGVLEFTNDTKLGELLGADFGLLGRYCAEEVERRLISVGQTKFGVVDRRRLQAALKSQGFGLSDLGSQDSLKRLSQGAGGMPVLALGTLRNRAGRVLSLQCKLVQTEQDEVLGAVSGMAMLNESEWAMLGRSAQVRPEDRRPETPVGGGPVRPISVQVIDRLDRRSQEAHPLLDPQFPLRVKIMVRDDSSTGVSERKGVFRGNDLFVPLRKDEVYEIWIENLTGRLVLMRLLVDGLNTLPETELTKGVQVETVASRVNLSDARPWHLDPQSATLYAVRGFVTETGQAGKLREFRVVDAQDSLAARQQFTGQIGLITAAFYSPAGGSRAIGTGLGAERQEEIGKADRVKVGNLIAVVNIRYVEPEALDRAQQ